MALSPDHSGRGDSAAVVRSWVCDSPSPCRLIFTHKFSPVATVGDFSPPPMCYQVSRSWCLPGHGNQAARLGPIRIALPIPTESNCAKPDLLQTLFEFIARVKGELKAKGGRLVPLNQYPLGADPTPTVHNLITPDPERAIGRLGGRGLLERFR
jgi:hypothetical protein